jgi:hypothetical protein
MADAQIDDTPVNYKIITVHIGDNSVIIGRKIWEKYSNIYNNSYFLFDDNGYPRAVYVDNNADIKKIMTEIREQVGSIITLACFNIIADLDSLMYYDVLSAIKKQYTNAILLNICIMPPTKIVLNPDVDNLILYNISAISNFTNSTILIDYDTFIEKRMAPIFKGKEIYIEDVENKIADILSYYIFIMFSCPWTRQEPHEIAKDISKSAGIATLAYLDRDDDNTNIYKKAMDLTENYLVGFKKSNIIYRRVICDDNNVETNIKKELVNEKLVTYSKIDTLYIKQLYRPTSPMPQGLTIVIDTGIKKFFSDIIDRLKIGKNDIIMDIYSYAGRIYDDLNPLTKLQITLSSFIAHMCLINEYKMDANAITQMNAAAGAFNSPIDAVSTAAAKIAAAAANAIKVAFPNEALRGMVPSATVSASDAFTDITTDAAAKAAAEEAAAAFAAATFAAEEAAAASAASKAATAAAASKAAAAAASKAAAEEAAEEAAAVAAKAAAGKAGAKGVAAAEEAASAALDAAAFAAEEAAAAFAAEEEAAASAASKAALAKAATLAAEEAAAKAAEEEAAALDAAASSAAFAAEEAAAASAASKAAAAAAAAASAASKAAAAKAAAAKAAAGKAGAKGVAAAEEASKAATAAERQAVAAAEEASKAATAAERRAVAAAEEAAELAAASALRRRAKAASPFIAFSNVYISQTVFRNKDIITAAVKKALTYTSSLKNDKTKFIITLNVIYEIIKQNDFFILKYPQELKEIIGLAIEAGKKLPDNSPDLLNMFKQLSQVEALNKVDLEILRLDRIDTYMAFLLENAENNFIVTVNVIYQIIKHNKTIILADKLKLKKIIDLAIEVGKKLPENSKYSTLYNTLRITTDFTEDNLENLRLYKIDDESFIDKSFVDVMSYILDKVIINYKNIDTNALTDVLNKNLNIMIIDAKAKDRAKDVTLDEINEDKFSKLLDASEASAELSSATDEFERAKYTLYIANDNMNTIESELSEASTIYRDALEDIHESITDFNTQQQNRVNDDSEYTKKYSDYLIKYGAANEEISKQRTLDADYNNKRDIYERMKASYIADIDAKLKIHTDNPNIVENLYNYYLLPFSKLVTDLLNQRNTFITNTSNYTTLVMNNINLYESLGGHKYYDDYYDDQVILQAESFEALKTSSSNFLRISSSCVESYKKLADEYNRIVDLYFTDSNTGTTTSTTNSITKTYYITKLNKTAWDSLNTNAHNMWLAIWQKGVDSRTWYVDGPSLYFQNGDIYRWAQLSIKTPTEPVLYPGYEYRLGTQSNLVLCRVLDILLTRIGNINIVDTVTATADPVINLNFINRNYINEIAAINMIDFGITEGFKSRLNSGITTYNTYLNDMKEDINNRNRASVIPEGRDAEEAFTALNEYNTSKAESNAKNAYATALSSLQTFTKTFTGFNYESKFTEWSDAEIDMKELEAKKISCKYYTLIPAQVAFNNATTRKSAADIAYNELIAMEKADDKIDNDEISKLRAVMDAAAELSSATGELDRAKNAVSIAQFKMNEIEKDLAIANDNVKTTREQYLTARDDSFSNFNTQQANKNTDDTMYRTKYSTYRTNRGVWDVAVRRKASLQEDYDKKNYLYTVRNKNDMDNVNNRLFISTQNSSRLPLTSSKILEFNIHVDMLVAQLNKFKENVNIYENDVEKYIADEFDADEIWHTNRYAREFEELKTSATNLISINNSCVDAYKELFDEYNLYPPLYNTTTQTYITPLTDRNALNALKGYATYAWLAIYQKNVSSDAEDNMVGLRGREINGEPMRPPSTIETWIRDILKITNDFSSPRRSSPDPKNGSIILCNFLKYVFNKIDDITIIAPKIINNVVITDAFKIKNNPDINNSLSKRYLTMLTTGITRYNESLGTESTNILTRVRSTIDPEGQLAETAFTELNNYNSSTVLSAARLSLDTALSELRNITKTFTGFIDYDAEGKYKALNDAEIKAKRLQADKISLNNYILMPARAALMAVENRKSDADIKYNKLIENYKPNIRQYTENYDALILSPFYLSLVHCSKTLINNTISRELLFNQVKNFIEVADAKKSNTSALNNSVAIYKLWLVFEIKSQLKSNVSLDDSIENIKNKISSEPNMNNKVYIEALDDIKNYFMLVNSTINKIEVLSGIKIT